MQLFIVFATTMITTGAGGVPPTIRLQLSNYVNISGHMKVITNVDMTFSKITNQQLIRGQKLMKEANMQCMHDLY